MAKYTAEKFRQYNIAPGFSVTDMSDAYSNTIMRFYHFIGNQDILPEIFLTIDRLMYYKKSEEEIVYTLTDIMMKSTTNICLELCEMFSSMIKFNADEYTNFQCVDRIRCKMPYFYQHTGYDLYTIFTSALKIFAMEKLSTYFYIADILVLSQNYDTFKHNFYAIGLEATTKTVYANTKIKQLNKRIAIYNRYKIDIDYNKLIMILMRSPSYKNCIRIFEKYKSFLSEEISDMLSEHIDAVYARHAMKILKNGGK